jgi:aerobic-type carbon monoxide dehydrogenase small subunit (CoxS/CutS family)
MAIQLNINGAARRADVDPQTTLLSTLRDHLGLTGAKYGCGEGQCGACTVLIDGKATRSCVTAAGSVVGKKITTIEGLAANGALHPVQQAFIDADAMQCGYCTPGMIMSGAALLDRNPNPSRDEIVRAMEGNVCRCGTYPRIVEAMRLASMAARRTSR